MAIKMHLNHRGTPLCTGKFGPVQAMRAKDYVNLPIEHRCAKCEAKAAKMGLFKGIVPDNVEPGSKEHLDALSKFFGI